MPRSSGSFSVPPFWSQMHQFFLFPFQGAPLLRMGVVFILSLLSIKIGMQMLGSVDENSGRTPSVFKFIAFEFVVSVFIFVYTTKYFFTIIQNSSRGLLKTKDFTPEWENFRSTSLHWKFLVAIVIASIIFGVLMGFFGVSGKLLAIILAVALPAIIISLVISESIFASINPVQWVNVILSISFPYIILVAYSTLLLIGNQALMGALSSVLGPELMFSIFVVANIYFLFVQGILTGYVMYEYHDQLGIRLDPRASSGDSSSRAGSTGSQSSTDQHVSEMIMSGNIQHAVDVAYEAQRTAPDDLAAQERYHKVLILAGKNEQLGHHAERYIPVLMSRSMLPQAVQVMRECQNRNAAVTLANPDHLMSMARYLAKRGDVEDAWKLIQHIDQTYYAHPGLPAALELGVRLLVQDLHRKDQALRWVELLEKRFPKSPHAQEARWLVR